MGVGEAATEDASAVGVMGTNRQCRAWPQLGRRGICFSVCRSVPSTH